MKNIRIVLLCGFVALGIAQTSNAAGLLGASYDTLVATFGQPKDHTEQYGGDSFTFEKSGWTYTVWFYGKTVGAIVYGKIDGSALSASEIEAIKTGYAEGMQWVPHGAMVARSDNHIFIHENVSTLKVASLEMLQRMGQSNSGR